MSALGQEILFQCLRVSYIALFSSGFILGYGLALATCYYYLVKFNSYEVVPTSITKKKKRK
jgi:hypothetical protein